MDDGKKSNQLKNKKGYRFSSLIKSDNILQHQQTNGMELDNIHERLPKQSQSLQPIQIYSDFHDQSYRILLKFLRLQLAKMGMNIQISEYCLQEQPIDIINKPINQIISELTAQIQHYEKELKIKQNNNIISAFIASPLIPIKINAYTNVINSSQDKKNIIIINQCGICICDIENETRLRCGHTMCSDCLRQYLCQKIMSAEIFDIKCPYDSCMNILSEDQIKSYVDASDFAKYLIFKENKLIQEDEAIRWCIRPNCKGFMKGNIFTQTLRCRCGQEVCYSCRQEAHPGQKCEVKNIQQFILLKEALDYQYKLIIEQLQIQKCPRCRSLIEKANGCNHMVCLMCEFEFCWLCRARFTFQHFNDYNCFGCPKKQFSVEQPYKRQKWKKYIGLLLDFIFSFLLIPILPIYLLIQAVCYPMTLCRRHNRRNFINYNENMQGLLIFIGILLLPISMVLQIVPEFIILIYEKIIYD